MPKKILLIENDPPIATRLSESLEASGYQARATADGKEGLELARDWDPAAIVLCVELPSMSGYLVCQKLKKDEALKGIPLVLTSAEATEETFEKHRTLKARADDYLLKPYEPEALIAKLGELIGLPDPADLPPGAPAEVPSAADADEELVSLEEEMSLDPADDAPADLPADLPGLSLESLPDEPPPAAGTATALEEDLRLLDDAFEGISAAPAAQEAAAALDELGGEPEGADELDGAAASLSEGAREDLPDLHDLDDDAAAGAPSRDEALSSFDAAPAAGLRGASADILRAAGIKLLDDGSPEEFLSPPDAELAAATGDAPHRDLGTDAELRELRGDVERARDDLAERDAELRALRRDAEALSRRAEDAEAELALERTRAGAAEERARLAEAEANAGREEARGAAEQLRSAEGELTDLRRRLADLERRAAEAERRAAAAEQEGRRKAAEAAAASEALARVEREVEELRTEVLVARGEAEGARGEVERRTNEVRKRVAELEATNAKNEERVVKAYQKIKADEKVRDKVRKALAIATQLLDEGISVESAAERERRAAGVGRE